MNPRILVAPLALWIAGCQLVPPPPLEAPATISMDVYRRFDLAGPEAPDSAAPAPLEPVHVLGRSAAADLEGVDAPAALIELDDVLSSVEEHFPLILAAEEEVEIAEGKLQAAQGGFDTRLGAKGKSEFEGYYEKNLFDVGIEQPTPLWGTSFNGGYRLGRGDFAVYEGGEKTDEGGEFRLGVSVPLLQSRTIDPRRFAVWKARINREQVDPFVLQKRLEATRKAANSYWKWVAAGRLREVAVRLLALAEDRMEQVELAVEEGLLASINLTENKRLIVDRRASLIRAERGLQEAAIELSLYWRDSEGRPAVPLDKALPYEFPTPRDATEILVDGDEVFALEQRPEARALELEQRSLRLERDLATNTLLPKLDVGFNAKQDVGAAVNDPDDKSDFELEAFLSLEVPLQRRRSKGKVRELTARLARLEYETRFLDETITADVQDARSALMQSWLRIAEARENVRLANELAQAERFQLREGESDLLRVNLREQQAAVSAASFVKVLEEYFRALAAYRAVLGIPHTDELPRS